jgi:hypothetical protein
LPGLGSGPSSGPSGGWKGAVAPSGKAGINLVEKIQPLSFVLQAPEEQTDNWDDDFEEGISFTKLQGPQYIVNFLEVVVETSFIQLWKKPHWMRTNTKSRITLRLFGLIAVQAKNLSRSHRHRPRKYSLSWRIIQTWQRRKTKLVWKRKWLTSRFVFLFPNRK